MYNDQSWPDSIMWSLNSDNLNSFKLNSDNLNSFKKMDDLKNYRLYQNYNRKYHENRLLYKQFINTKTSNLWTNRFSKSHDHENIKTLAPDYACFSSRMGIRQTQQSIGEINAPLKIGHPLGLDARDGHKMVQDIVTLESCRDRVEVGECCCQGGVTRSAGDRCPCARCFPKLFTGRIHDKHPKPKHHSVYGANKNMKSRPGHVSFPKIHTKSSLVHNESLPATSVLNSFRCVNKMNDGGYKHPMHEGSSDSSVIQNTKSHFTNLNSNMSNQPADLSTHSLNECSDSLADSLSIRIESLQPVLPPVAAYSVNQTNNNEHMRQSRREAEQDTITVSETPSRKETKQAPTTVTVERTQQRPARALHKVIFRTKDETGVMVITAIGINEAAMMR